MRSGRRSACLAVVGWLVAGRAGAAPNILLLMTDNQEKAAMSELGSVNSRLAPRGTTFADAIVSYPLCCPTRSTWLTGQYAHNHGVRENGLPLGGYTRLDDRETLAVWLQRGGYYTGLIGKYLQGYGSLDSDPTDLVPACLERPPGWDEWYANVLNPYYYDDYVVNENGTLVGYGNPAPLPVDCPVTLAPSQYQTDQQVAKALDFLRRRVGAADGKPFFLWLSFNAPHGQGRAGEWGPEPAPRHAGSRATTPLPLPPSFNEADMSDKPPAIAALPLLDQATIDDLTSAYRRRLESLAAVDEGIGQILDQLEASGMMSSTVVLFTSDQGHLNGEHRMMRSGWPYAESIDVPLVIRGPGFPAGYVEQRLVGDIDMAPTILELAGASSPLVLDGASLVPLVADPTYPWRAGILLESWNYEPAKDFFGYRTTRHEYIDLVGVGVELYDRLADPYQLASANGPEYDAMRYGFYWEVNRLKTCAGASCWIPEAGDLQAAGPPLLAVKDGAGGIRLSWAATCTATDTAYALYSGSLGLLGDHAPLTCDTGGAHGWTTPAPPGSVYYFATTRNATVESLPGFAPAAAPGSALCRAPASSGCN